MAECACVLFLSDVALVDGEKNGPKLWWAMMYLLGGGKARMALQSIYAHLCLRQCLSEMVSILLIAGSSPASSSAVIKEGPTLAGTICCAQVEMMVRAIGVCSVNRHLGFNSLDLTNEFKIQLEIGKPRRVL